MKSTLIRKIVIFLHENADKAKKSELKRLAFLTNEARKMKEGRICN
jgi:hypothetical protein